MDVKAMLALTYSMKKEIKVAKWGTPKKYLRKKKEKKNSIDRIVV